MLHVLCTQQEKKLSFFFIYIGPCLLLDFDEENIKCNVLLISNDSPLPLCFITYLSISKITGPNIMNKWWTDYNWVMDVLDLLVGLIEYINQALPPSVSWLFQVLFFFYLVPGLRLFFVMLFPVSFLYILFALLIRISSVDGVCHWRWQS